MFFLAGSGISLLSLLALLYPGGPLEPMWRLNPRAREGFAGMGPWAIVLMAVVSLACGFSAAGLWRGGLWGWRLALSVLTVNVVGDATNALVFRDPRTAIGVPIGGAMMVYLWSRRRFFSPPRPDRPATGE